jgi:hypothetical protein
MGYQPDWFIYLAAARYLNLPAPALMDLPTTWLHWALDALSAVNFAEGENSRRAREKASKRR